MSTLTTHRYLATTAILWIVFALSGCVPTWIPDAADDPVNAAGYEIEDLPVVITASYARGDDVYLGLDTGEIMKASDSRFTGPWTDLGHPLDGGPRLLFASSAGVLFTSADHHPVYRSADDGITWQQCLDVPVWRMDEDDEGGLYAGIYIKDSEHVATLYKSVDAGLTWNVVFSDETTNHIHTVRWDERGKRLYVAFGDGDQRGQAYSDDHGTTFQVIVRGPLEGHTDIAFTRDYIFWCTDNATGQILRISRATADLQVITGLSQFVWFGVAGDEQLYVGTVVSQRFGGERAALLASADQGETWQKLSQTALSTGVYSQGFFAESRQLSAGGWLYCTGGDEHGPRSYRVRRAQPAGASTSAVRAGK